MSLLNTGNAMMQGAAITAAVVAILLFIFVLTRALALEQIPLKIAQWLVGVTDNRIVLLLMLNVILLIIGMVVDDVSGSILAAIVLLPVATSPEVGLHPVHFAGIVGVNIAAGNITPPCAPLLYLAGAVGRASLLDMLAPVGKFMLFGYLPVILLVTYVPDLVLFLPRALLGV